MSKLSRKAGRSGQEGLICEACNKLAFPSEHRAKAFRMRELIKGRECRVYHEERCGWWHVTLTKQE